MEYLFYARDVPGTEALRDELLEEHWSFMDGYADAMIARGPTLTADRETATGSIHIVDLPDAAAAQTFAFEEPYYRAGVFGDVLIRRWRNALGRTMWEYQSDQPDYLRFLVLGHGRADVAAEHDALLDEHRRFLAANAGCFIARGALLGDDGTGWLGSAMLVELPDRAAAEAMFAAEPFARAGLYATLEIHDWQFGGRS